jgi:hypothetical protein
MIQRLTDAVGLAMILLISAFPNADWGWLL